METSYLKTLELDKIIARASEGCVCKEAREQLLALEPQCDPDEVRYALEQTDAINSLLIKNGSPRFGGVEGVSSLVARAVKGGVLSMGELLMVAGALRNFQNLTSWYGSSEHDALHTDDLFYALAPQPGLEQQISSARHGFPHPERAAQKNPRYGKQHPRPAGKHGPQYGYLQVFAGECGLHSQWTVCCAR